MRILFFGNNLLGLRVLEWLRAQDEQIVGLALHPYGQRRYGDEIVRAGGLGESGTFDGSRLTQLRAEVERLRPDIGVSVLFGYVLRRDILDLFPSGCLNLHPSLLPYNRGAYPNVWSILDGTPAGASLHYMDEGIDTGDLVAQREIPVEPVDTGETLYRRLEDCAFDLFRETWPMIREGRASRTPQSIATGTVHRRADVERYDEIELDRSYTGRELIDLLRARSFPPYPGAYFRRDGRKVEIRVQLRYAAEGERPA
jgi:methionyl-tRNA formyltransferase